MIQVVVSGFLGRMGREVARLVGEDEKFSLLCGVDAKCGEENRESCVPSFDRIKGQPDVIIDFSHHSLTGNLTRYAVEKKVPLVIATTGQTEEEMQTIREASCVIPVFYSSNYSLGIALLTDAAKRIAEAMPDAEIEIVEKHHDRKLDAPSGTALSIARELQKVRPEAEIISGRSGYGKRTKEEIGIQSIRIGNCVGEHEVLIGTQTQTITLKHEAHDRALFAEGALAAASFLLGRKPGFYGMEDLLKN